MSEACGPQGWSLRDSSKKFFDEPLIVDRLLAPFSQSRWDCRNCHSPTHLKAQVPYLDISILVYGERRLGAALSCSSTVAFSRPG